MSQGIEIGMREVYDAVIETQELAVALVVLLVPLVPLVHAIVR